MFSLVCYKRRGFQDEDEPMGMATAAYAVSGVTLAELLGCVCQRQ